MEKIILESLYIIFNSLINKKPMNLDKVIDLNCQIKKLLDKDNKKLHKDTNETITGEL